MPKRRDLIAVPFAALALGLAIEPAQAQSSGRLRLDGQLPADCHLRILDVTPNLDLSRGLREFPLALIGERCNVGAGYRIVLVSRNGGMLRGSRGALPYTISYGPLADTRLAQPKGFRQRAPQPELKTRTLAVTAPPTGGMPPDMLSDQVMLSVEAP